MEQQNSTVLATQISTSDGHKIGLLTLNKPKALNALDLDMASTLLSYLRQWEQSDDVVCIVLNATGEKAFCAGGDIVSMYNAMRDSSGEIPEFLADFFKTEYTLDYAIHNYPKPIIVWGDGIVMGGGMGLLCGASHRIVTETSRLAMPEITIGLYPDVGGSYFLPRLPGKTGLFLGLTGGQMNGVDACYVGLADALVRADEKDTLLEKLTQHQWSSSPLDEQVTHIVNSLNSPDTCPEPNVEAHIARINSLCQGDSVVTVVNNILNADMGDDKWLNRAQSTLAKGSPITAHLVFEQCKRGINMSLADCFRMEATMSCRCGQSGEFQEGVRALLIDKDLSPKWKYPTVDAVPKEVVDGFFVSPWSEHEHPLAHLN